VHNPDCTKCELHKVAKSVCVKGRGPKKADVLFVVQAPGPPEDREGRALLGRAGKLFDKVMEEGINDEEGTLSYRVTNVVRCFPGFKDEDEDRINKPKAKHIKACREYLDAEIREVQPRMIIPMGGPASKALAGDGRITKVRGLKFTWTDPEDETFQIPVMPIYHPSFVDRDQKLRYHEWGSDIIRALQMMDGEAEEEFDYHLIETLDGAIDLIDKIISLHTVGKIKSLSLDVETDGDKGAESPLMKCWDPKGGILSVQLCWEEGIAYMIPLHHPECPMDPLEVAALEKNHLPRLIRHVPIYGQNIKFDCHWIREKWGIWPKVDFDTLLAHQVLYSGTKPNGLSAMVGWYVPELGGYDIKLRQCINAMPNGTEDFFGQVPLREILCDYGCGDVDAVFRLREIFEKWLEDDGLVEAMRLVMSAFQTMAEMEAEGFVVDHQVHAEMVEGYLERVAGPAKRAFFSSPYYRQHEARTGMELSLNSPPQLRTFFFETLGCVSNKKTKGGEASCDKEALAEIWDGYIQYRPVVEALQTVKQAGKFHSTYIKGLKKHLHPDGRVRPNYKLEGTDTGRLSASKPPIHNIPRGSELRRMFRSRHDDGLILQLDYSQAELRVLAMLSGDETFSGVFQRGEDMHTAVAAAVFQIPASLVTPEQRNIAKTVIFGLIYGRGAKAIASVTTLNEHEAKAFIGDFLLRFPQVDDWLSKHKILGVKDEGIWTPLGRRRLLPRTKFDTAEIERRAVNTVIQSTASDLTLLSAVAASRKLAAMECETRLVSFVHDALIFDVPPAEVWQVATMAQSVMVTVPLGYGWAQAVPMEAEPEVGPSWGEKCKMTLGDDGVFTVRGDMDMLSRMKWVFREMLSGVEMGYDKEKKKEFFVLRVCMMPEKSLT